MNVSPESAGSKSAGLKNAVSFMGANYVARQVGYRMTGGWGQGDRAASEHFRPLETFRERFTEIVSDVGALGFTAMDVWSGHISPQWVTTDHLQVAKAVLDEYGMEVPSLAGWFGSTREEFDATCRIAEAFSGPVLGGSTSLLDKDREHLVAVLRATGLRLGVENHPEKTPAELRARLGETHGLIGVTVDTGWFGTQGYDAAVALEELADVLFYVHLKDVLTEGMPHATCRFGAGVVPLERCVETLGAIGYTGAISIEHEPETFDPTEDVAASRAILAQWMEAA